MNKELRITNRECRVENYLRLSGKSHNLISFSLQYLSEGLFEKNGLVIILFMIVLFSLFTGCGSYQGWVMTRTEVDTFHKTYVEEQSRREPLGTDYGVLKPSRKQSVVDRVITEYDSICNRHYPAFSRLGLFEVAGLIASVSSPDDDKIGNGLLGVYNTFGPASTRRDAIFNGYFFRFGIYEKRLSFIGKDWTIGTSFMEGIFGDTREGQQLLGLFPIYVKKKFFLREDPPLASIQPFLGLSMLAPYRYLNVGVTAQLGSYGGANLFAHLGFAYGGPSSQQVSDVTTPRSIPYFGLGLSMFDFTNTEKDMDTQWRFHESQVKRVALAHLTLLQSSVGANGIVFPGDNGEEVVISRDFDGFIIQLGTVAFPAEFVMKNFTVGTTLLNIMYLGSMNGGIGILPLRATYQWWIFKKLLIEPFVEFNYYPSNVGHIGARLNFGDFVGMNLGVQVGGMYGNSGELTRNVFPDFTTDVKGVYAGLTFSLVDHYSSPVIDFFRSLKDCRTPYGSY